MLSNNGLETAQLEMVFTFLPDRGHDPGGQSGSSCCWGTFGLTRYQGVGHSEQNHGQRSFHCTPCPASPTPVVNIVRNNIETKHSWQFSELLLMKQLALSRRRRIFIIIIIIINTPINHLLWLYAESSPAFGCFSCDCTKCFEVPLNVIQHT